MNNKNKQERIWTFKKMPRKKGKESPEKERLAR
jgi:hypothetical protein